MKLNLYKTEVAAYIIKEMPDFVPFKVKKPSMNVLGPIVILMPVLIALYFCEWQVVIAFFLAVSIVPFALIFLINLFQQKAMGFNDVLETGLLLSIAGIPIYCILILPIYYVLKSSSMPMPYSFPASVSIIMVILYTLITTKPWDYKAALVVTTCSTIHALFIIWLISKLKSISF